MLTSPKAPSSVDHENPTASAPTIQHRRSSADEALITRGDSDKRALSPPSPPPSSSTKENISNVEQRRRRRHLFISHRTVHSETQKWIDETIPVATVIVTLENDENAVKMPLCMSIFNGIRVYHFHQAMAINIFIWYLRFLSRFDTFDMII